MQKQKDYCLNSYYKEIKAGLAPCGKTACKKVMDELENSVNDYLALCPSAQMDDIIQTFGSPEQIIENNMVQVPATRKVPLKTIVTIVLVGILLVLLAFAAYFIFSLYDSWTQAESGMSFLDYIAWQWNL